MAEKLMKESGLEAIVRGVFRTSKASIPFISPAHGIWGRDTFFFLVLAPLVVWLIVDYIGQGWGEQELHFVAIAFYLCLYALLEHQSRLFMQFILDPDRLGELSLAGFSRTEIVRACMLRQLYRRKLIGFVLLMLIIMITQAWWLLLLAILYRILIIGDARREMESYRILKMIVEMKQQTFISLLYLPYRAIFSCIIFFVVMIGMSFLSIVLNPALALIPAYYSFLLMQLFPYVFLILCFYVANRAIVTFTYSSYIEYNEQVGSMEDLIEGLSDQNLRGASIR